MNTVQAVMFLCVCVGALFCAIASGLDVGHAKHDVFRIALGNLVMLLNCLGLFYSLSPMRLILSKSSLGLREYLGLFFMAIDLLLRSAFIIYLFITLRPRREHVGYCQPTECSEPRATRTFLCFSSNKPFFAHREHVRHCQPTECSEPCATRAMLCFSSNKPFFAHREHVGRCQPTECSKPHATRIILCFSSNEPFFALSRKAQPYETVDQQETSHTISRNTSGSVVVTSSIGFNPSNVVAPQLPLMFYTVPNPRYGVTASVS